MNLLIQDVNYRAAVLAAQIQRMFIAKPMILLYGVPRGGIPVAFAIAAQDSSLFKVVDSPVDADIVVDDIIDSGATREKYNYKPFVALIDKQKNPSDEWVVFPWEETAEKGIEDHVTRILQYIGGESDQDYFKTAVNTIVASLGQIKDSTRD